MHVLHDEDDEQAGATAGFGGGRTFFSEGR